MSIRLNKALRELNIGLQTAVEFLEKKSELGEVKAEPSFKLNDEQYAALVKAFQQDAAVRTEAEKLFKKPKEELFGATSRQQYTPLGKIDLGNVGNKSAASKSAAPDTDKKDEAKAAAVSPAAAVAKEEQKKAPKEEPKVAPEAKVEKHEPEAKSKLAAENAVKTEPVKSTESVAQPVEAEKTARRAKKPAAVKVAEVTSEKNSDQKNETEIFQLKSERKIANTPKVNILGKIDLDSLNQSTRPKKQNARTVRKKRASKVAVNTRSASA